ncbi:MAG: hypothetical protein QOD09_1561 [Bradyrhizobium sp.]|jgi:hypothetical protein|nr:hypothetical protein [Bradyrhizobium sp.]
MRVACADSGVALKISEDRDREPEGITVKPVSLLFVAGNQLSREILMSRKNARLSRAAIAACALLPAATAVASQGPGGGMGTAGNFTQAAMAILVYGASALIVGAGLIGALRRR